MKQVLIHDSYHTLSANVISQLAGASSFLFLPNLLQMEGYAATVYVSILLYYVTFTDLGLIQVYRRRAPGMLANGRDSEVWSFENNIKFFWAVTALIYGTAAMVLYYKRYNDVFDSIALVIMIFLTPFVNFHIHKQTVRGGFVEYGRLTIVQSLSKIFSVAGAAVFSLRGWFIGSILGFAAVFFFSRDNDIWKLNTRSNPVHVWPLIPEGITLAFITMIWGTLLMLGRVFAVLVCPESVIAEYGIINAGFQMISLALISIFLPMTIKIYAMCVGNLTSLLWFVFRLQVMAVLVSTNLGLIASNVAPFLFVKFFRGYTFDPVTINLIMLSFIPLPFLVTTGPVLIGKELSRPYLLILAVIFGLSCVFLHVTYSIFENRTPAVTQLIFMSVAAVSISFFLWYSFYTKKIKSLLMAFFPYALVAAIILLYHALEKTIIFFYNPPAATLIASVIAIFITLLFWWWIDRKRVPHEGLISSFIRH